VKTILNKYQKVIINANEDKYIDLDRIDVIYDYPNRYSAHSLKLGNFKEELKINRKKFFIIKRKF
jgi:hypothetical protein